MKAVEWLVNVVQSCIAPDYIPTKIIEQAKEMERQELEKMYSEEEVLQLLLRLQQTESYDNLYDWFEQFKKK